MAIAHNLFTLKRRLEILKQREYSWVEISKATEIHHNTLYNIGSNKTRRVDLDIVEKLLKFFSAEGMPVTINDLFTVTDTPGE